MAIQFWNNQILFVNGQIAMDPRCCYAQCSYTVRVTIDWSNNADLDLYGTVDGRWAIYYARPSHDGLTLSVDAHPVCWGGPMPPEEQTGAFDAGHTFHFWYDQYSNCEVETAPGTHHIEIANTGATPICVNGQVVNPGQTWQTDTLAYAGYATWGSPGFGGGTEVEVVCGSCP